MKEKDKQKKGVVGIGSDKVEKNKRRTFDVSQKRKKERKRSKERTGNKEPKKPLVKEKKIQLGTCMLEGPNNQQRIQN